MLLRLEFLFRQIQYYRRGETEWDSRAAMASLFELLAVFGRGDLKIETIKELERLQANLSRFEETPNVDQEHLSGLLRQIGALAETLRTSNIQLSHQIKDNEFLHSIRQRSTIFAGTCDFDLPDYHYWLNLPPKQRLPDLEHWLQGFDPIRHATELVLQLIRGSAPVTPQVAKQGLYQQNLDINTPYQMVRIILPPSTGYFPEISGGKHRFSVRFMKFSINKQTQPIKEDVHFELCCCAI